VTAGAGVARLPVVGVMGSGREPHEELAAPLGDWIARSGFHLVTGAGGGVMEAAARAFCAVPGRAGLSIGIVRAAAPPALDTSGRRGYRPNRLNDWLEVRIHTHLHTSDQTFASRNHLNVLSADALVVLPGDGGTDSELRLAAQYGRRAVLFLGEKTVLGKSAAQLAADAALAPFVTAAASLEEVGRAVREVLA
jgi:uncharacterized protein (TIGR00725 family)